MRDIIKLKKEKKTVQLLAAKFYNNIYLNNVRAETVKDCNQFFKIYQKQKKTKKTTLLLKLSTQMGDNAFNFTSSSSRNEPKFVNARSFVDNYGYFYSN